MASPAPLAAIAAAPASSLHGSDNEAVADTAEEPHSPAPVPVPAAAAGGAAAGLTPSGDPLLLPLAFAAGAAIALLALLVPLVTVALDRADHPGAAETLPSRPAGGSAGPAAGQGP